MRTKPCPPKARKTRKTRTKYTAKIHFGKLINDGELLIFFVLFVFFVDKMQCTFAISENPLSIQKLTAGDRNFTTDLHHKNYQRKPNLTLTLSLSPVRSNSPAKLNRPKLVFRPANTLFIAGDDFCRLANCGVTLPHTRPTPM